LIAARFSEETLAELRKLPPLEAHVYFNEFFSLNDQRIDILRQQAAAASSGDTVGLERLHAQYNRLTHRLWMLSTGLESCPPGVSGWGPLL
jgi:hypothetical protein